MQSTLNIPEPYAGRIALLAQRQGITPTQWVTQAIVRAAPSTPGLIGRPRVNEARDAAIRRKRAAGATIMELAQAYGLHRSRIVQVCRENEVSI